MSRNLTKFATLSAYNAAVDAQTLVCPNVSYIEETDDTKFLKSNPDIGVGIKALVEGVAGYYTLEQWNALIPLVTALPTEEGTTYVRMQPTAGGTVTYYKWNGTAYASTNVIVPVGTYTKQGASVGLVIHGTLNTSVKWSNNTTVQISGVTTTTNQAGMLTDYKGMQNTDAVLNAVSLGTIADAPLFDWARNTIKFADGSLGYVPAGGELNLIKQNLAQVNGCRTALGHASIVFDGRSIWTSTQYHANGAWSWYSTFWYDNLKSYSTYGLAVCAL